MIEIQSAVTEVLNAPRVQWKFNHETEWQYGRPVAYTDQPSYIIERESDGLRIGVLASFNPRPAPTDASSGDVPENWDEIVELAKVLTAAAGLGSPVGVTEIAQAEAVLKHLATKDDEHRTDEPASALDTLPRDSVVIVENDDTHRWLAWKANAGDWDVITPRGEATTMTSAEVAALGAWRELVHREPGPGHSMTDQLFIRVPLQEHTALVRQLTAVLAENVRLASRTDGDEHHTLDELYEYRMLYNALAANAWAAHGTYPVVKSWRHSDGEQCFGGGWFIVVATLPTGQVSNHYAAEHWDLFAVPEVETPPEYDGHDPAEAARRMLALLSQPSPSAESCICTLGPDTDGPNIDCPIHGMRPSIEDMAPGTALTADITFAHRFLRTTNGLLDIDDGMTVGMDDIDPSTIRDVAPPSASGSRDGG